jgi:hypothetical protein
MRHFDPASEYRPGFHVLRDPDSAWVRVSGPIYGKRTFTALLFPNGENRDGIGPYVVDISHWI